MTQVSVGGREILVARVGDRYYSADNRCPHMGGNLSQGTLEGTILTCPRHHSQFDLTDGHVVRWTDWTGILLATGKLLKSPRPIKTHPVSAGTSATNHPSSAASRVTWNSTASP
jgi:3-phenylpropionate/trans-cinnamate dioxygenase ferredoxin subunit